QGRVSAGLAALRAAVEKDRSGDREVDRVDGIRERLARITGRDGVDTNRAGRDGPEVGAERADRSRAQERLREALDRDRGAERDTGAEDGGKPSIRGRLEDVLNTPRERLEPGVEREAGRDVERDWDEREVHRGVDRDRGIRH
ncbi:MAG: molybdopterin-guanine dinucleotide biosynthesis protein MobA, partial [Jannaschia sp.]